MQNAPMVNQWLIRIAVQSYLYLREFSANALSQVAEDPQWRRNVDVLNGEKKQAYFWLSGLAIFLALMCAVDISTDHLDARDYMTGAAFGSTVGAMAGAVFGYTCRLALSGTYAFLACFKAAVRRCNPKAKILSPF